MNHQSRGARVIHSVGLVAFAFALAGCGPSGTPSDSAKFMAARDAVKDRLRDPDSADFRRERLSAYEGREAVCGEVNSANAFGGKSGFQRYVSNAGEATVLEEQMDPAEFEAVWSAMNC